MKAILAYLNNSITAIDDYSARRAAYWTYIVTLAEFRAELNGPDADLVDWETDDEALLVEADPTDAFPRAFIVRPVGNHESYEIVDISSRALVESAFSLEELKALMDANLLSGVSELPVFGGTEAVDTRGPVWSWDADRVLIGAGSNLEIMPRDEYDALR